MTTAGPGVGAAAVRAFPAGEVAIGAAGVASGHPLAAEAGMEALAAGGSAVDAALAAAFTQWVVNAPQCGPGGELLALVADADGAAVTAYGGWSRVPAAIDPAAPLTDRGPKSSAVPGALRGAEAVWRACGRLGWPDLFAAGLAAAEGHETTPRMGEVYTLVAAKGFDEALVRMLGSPEPPRPGQTIRLAALAESLAELAAGGADALYYGELGDRVGAAAVADGAWLRREDLHAAEAVVATAVHCRLDDIEVWASPPPSYAPITPALAAAVSPQADPAGRDFAAAQAPLIEQRLTALCVQGSAGTTVTTAVDGDGLSVTVVHSLAGVQFGSGWVAGDTGIALSNRVGASRSNRPDLPAVHPRRGEILPHTLSAAHVRRRGPGRSRWMTLATSGGDRQVQWLAQAVQRFRRDEPAAAIVSGPRWFVCPEGDRFGVPHGIGKPWYAFAEPGVEWRDDARVAGYQVKQPDNVGGGLQAAVGLADGGVELGSDPRAGGAARATGGKTGAGSSPRPADPGAGWSQKSAGLEAAGSSERPTGPEAAGSSGGPVDGEAGSCTSS